ncbi:interleukin-4 [Puntigrus tetrazona]|uniref:interleukin-4 n=1 Tax=Puntigrus tetrazona TaxID=1606681 RepID=UPI001C8A91E2|nr:interleukin-4 [Puntigrus tetrazona]
MRTLTLLMLTVVAATGLREDNKTLLKEIVDHVELMLEPRSGINLDQYVKHVFPEEGCSAKHFCQAGKVITNRDLSFTMLRRRLFAYANHSGIRHCSVRTSQEDKMGVFLTKIKNCCKKLNSRKHPE